MLIPSPPPPSFDDFLDDGGWEDMPIVRDTDEFAGVAGGLDEEDQKKYRYNPQTKKESQGGGISNATGAILDVDYEGNEWRSKVEQNENDYTRVRTREEEDADEVHLRTKYLFDEDKAMTPLGQMQQTKNMLTEAQRIAYVAVCALVSTEMLKRLKIVNVKELKHTIQDTELWRLKILGRLYYHMELATAEQKMIESLAEHGVQPSDLVPALMTTHTTELRKSEAEASSESDDISEITVVESSTPPKDSPTIPATPKSATFQTTSRVLETTSTAAVPGVSTSLSAADENVTLDIRWTVLCDLFLVLIADSVYDARSRVLLEMVAVHLGLGWLDLVKFEQRVTEALEIQEDIESLEQRDIIEKRQKSSRRRRYMMVGLATLGGGLVIGLSAGLLAPVIGAGLGAAFTTIGISGTTGFLGGIGGAAVITTGGVLTGSGIAATGMARRTKVVRTFDILPLHNNKRVNSIITVPGFLNGELDDPRLPFTVLDPVVGDVFSVLWEPEMIRETGSALRILTAEILSQIGQTVLAATAMTALMSALQWPIILTKLGYLIDNPAKAAGSVLADVLIQRQLGVRPITLIGFSLGARVIFYALLELANKKAFGIVQDVIMLGSPLTASRKTWFRVRSAVSGRFFRATSGGVGTVAGLRPVENIPGVENVDVTDKISGHISYRTFMPLIMDQLGFPVSADHFDEPEQPDFEEERIVVREGEEVTKKGWFSRTKPQSSTSTSTPLPPTVTSVGQAQRPGQEVEGDEDLPPRESNASEASTPSTAGVLVTGQQPNDVVDDIALELPAHAGFDLAAMRAVIEDIKEGQKPQQDMSGRPPLETPPPLLTQVAATKQGQVTTPVVTSSLEIPPTSDPATDNPSDPTYTSARVTSLGDSETGPSRSDDVKEDAHEDSLSHSPSSLPFKDGDEGSWVPDVPEKDVFGGFGTPVGNPFRPTSFAAMSSTALPTNTSSMSLAAPFADRDPWSFPTYSGDVSASASVKKPPAFATNPWES
ncbi:hypothetical protein F5148DRAFT_1297728 [Russula earlei]|uniref:Uncharacterized protein n=1 Tax=Russula earlei TaxID=71964 RepID=A0ACC0UK41_9AGAM|nr:hypothetical protein F5148DRAFT_1297728 [Russula earlei]